MREDILPVTPDFVWRKKISFSHLSTAVLVPYTATYRTNFILTLDAASSIEVVKNI